MLVVVDVKRTPAVELIEIGGLVVCPLKGQTDGYLLPSRDPYLGRGHLTDITFLCPLKRHNIQLQTFDHNKALAAQTMNKHHECTKYIATTSTLL